MAGTGDGRSTSRRYALDRVDLRKLGTGFVIALVGAAATWLSDAATSLDFGMWSPFVAMAISVAVNAMRKWAAENSTPPAAGSLPGAPGRSRRVGWTMEAVVVAITVLTIGLLVLVLVLGASNSPTPEGGEASSTRRPSDPDVTGAFVMQRQLFARVCLEAAKRERAGLIASEEAENAWCEPRWAAARTEAFGMLVESRDRQLAQGWTPEASAAGLEAWAVAADPTLVGEAHR